MRILRQVNIKQTPQTEQKCKVHSFFNAEKINRVSLFINKEDLGFFLLNILKFSIFSRNPSGILPQDLPKTLQDIKS